MVETLSSSAPTPNGSGEIGIDIGWRRLPDGLRVAYWHDDCGASGEIRLDERFLAGMRRVDDLRGIRDRHFNAARDALQAWLATADAPDWLRQATVHLGQWKAHGRLTALVWRWRNQRFGGDGEIYALLEAWRRRERHLLAYESHLRDRLLRQRREQYRLFAADVAHRYGRVVLEDFNLAKVAQVKNNGKGAELPPMARW